MTIGDNVRKIRKEKKLTQIKLAEEIGISRSYLGDIENNRKNPTEKTINALAEKLNVSMYYLTTGQKTTSDIIDEALKEQAKNEKKIHEQMKGITGGITKSVTEGFKGITTNVAETFKTLNINSENELKEEMKQLINSELSFAEVNYLINALKFLKNRNEEDMMTLAALIRTIRQTDPEYIEALKAEGSYNEEELKNFINDTTKYFKNFIEERSGIKK